MNHILDAIAGVCKGRKYIGHGCIFLHRFARLFSQTNGCTAPVVARIKMEKHSNDEAFQPFYGCKARWSLFYEFKSWRIGVGKLSVVRCLLFVLEKTQALAQRQNVNNLRYNYINNKVLYYRIIYV